MPDNLDEVADAIRKKRCILFLGAGAHAAPPVGSEFNYPEQCRPSLGSALSDHLASRTDFHVRYPHADAYNLQRVSLDYEILRGRRELISEIRTLVDSNKSASPALHALARMDFPLVMTTNYDQIFERALIASGKRPVITAYKSNELTVESTEDYPYDEEPAPERPFVLKIHGDVVLRPDSIVVTDEDYIQFVLRMSDKGQQYPIPETFLFYLKKWPTLFIGYSLMDYNLRLLFKTLRWKIARDRIPATYSVDRSPDPLIFDVWHQQRRYVNYIVQDIWTFVPTLYERIYRESMPR